ncbi:hypothetical protein LINPERHAP1_LOCUS27722 [Linum perenne]
MHLQTPLILILDPHISPLESTLSLLFSYPQSPPSVT